MLVALFKAAFLRRMKNVQIAVSRNFFDSRGFSYFSTFSFVPPPFFVCVPDFSLFALFFFFFVFCLSLSRCLCYIPAPPGLLRIFSHRFINNIHKQGIRSEYAYTHSHDSLGSCCLKASFQIW